MASAIFDLLPTSLQWAVYQDPLDTGIFAVFLGLGIVHICYCLLATRQQEDDKCRHYYWLSWADFVFVIGGLLGICVVVPLNMWVYLAGIGLALYAGKQGQSAVYK